MKVTKFRRITALLLAILCVFGGMTVSASADTPKSANSANSEESMLANIKELLNAISYNEYVQLEEYVNAAQAKAPVSIKGTDGRFYDDAGKEVSSQGNNYVITGNALLDAETNKAFNRQLPGILTDATVGKAGIYLPDTGKVEWDVPGVTESAKYNMYIEYYPIDNKSADVERIFMINGEVPFAEARYISMSKYWSTPYPQARLEITKKMDANAVLKDAQDAGFFDARLEKGTKKNKEVTYMVCSYPQMWTEANTKFVDDYDLRFFTADIDNNEIRESLNTTPQWSTYTFKDANGFVQEPFSIVVGPDDNGNVTITLEGVNEPVVISKIDLVPATNYIKYSDYIAQLGGYAATKGQGQVKIEAEYFSGVSDQTIYPLADTTSAANSPVATNKTYLNTIGGEKWQTVGQWVEYDFTVPTSGMYSFATRYKQNVLEGMSTSRVLYIYSGAGLLPGQLGYYNGIPFEEATRLKFNYSDNWQSAYLSDGTTDFEFYFQAGVQYTIRLEVSLGAMGDIVRRVQEVLDAVNTDYLNILKVTGTSPDEFTDYNFYRTLPGTMADMYEQYEEIAVSNPSENFTCIIDTILKDSSKSSMTATLENVATLLYDMSTDEDEVAKNLTQLKTYIGSLGTWLGDAKTQPLTLDFITVQPKSAELPRASAGFFAALWHEITGFFQSFFRNYDRMGALNEVEKGSAEESVEVWLAYGRDQSQVIRNLINNDFTKNTGITVNLKLVAGGTLLPSILAGKGPDVYLGLGSGDVINYAIRGALAPVEEMPGFQETKNYFNDEAMMVLAIECAGKTITRKDGSQKANEGHEQCGTGRTQQNPHYYGLPETQGFPMMFVREDILANLNIEVPKTWDDVKETIPVLQANNMEIAMSSDSNIFIYQMGGELFADGGMRINLDSNVSLTAFETMCEMFTMYSFPYQYDFANRFRTGEMPIGFADYTGTYNQLKVFATEIEGLWSFYPLPGMSDEEG
ncbi:MAG: extracellular solute-binding protein, partial [Ruminococcaceae bacterium]|nr:extracellular solute-binding protein [Oscillospiraceae bacterium]